MKDGTKELERKLKVLGNRRRLSILKFLKNSGKASVGDIAAEIRLSFKSTSKHLSILSHADLLEKEQSGLTIFYSLAPADHPVASKVLSLL